MRGKRKSQGKKRLGNAWLCSLESCADRLYFNQLSETQTCRPDSGKSTRPVCAARPLGLYTVPTHPVGRVLFQIQIPAGLPGQGEELSLPPGLAQVPKVPGGGQTSTLPREWLCLPAFPCSELPSLPERAPEPPVSPQNSEGHVSALFQFPTLPGTFSSCRQSPAAG